MNDLLTVDHAIAPDGIQLHVEQVGSGVPVLFIHEFAGDHRSWEPQMRSFGRRYRSIVYAARGYPPSDVPEDVSSYSQDAAVSDAIAVLDHLGVGRAHVIGLSMGGFTALHLGLRHPDRVRSVVAAGVGYGAHPDAREPFRAETEAIAAAFESDGPGFTARYAEGPARVQFQNKDQRGWEEFARQLADHSPLGSANTMRGVQRERPSLYDLREDLAAMTVAVLLIVGDEDEGCLDTNLMLKRTMPLSGLAVLPRSGHTSNLEEPELFNRLVYDFLAQVDADRWEPRDPRSISTTTTGVAISDKRATGP
jgi:pimeloyl-ACP methyl ester carboxylesterase